MGGKSKQARVKNNAKPSNSSRSAELLGNTVPAFVGFSAQSDLGLMSFAPGFSDNVVDSPEANIDPQLQLILRKMSKKDPVTKVKALQEFREQLNAYDVGAVKIILPLWPKLYYNLANDVDHRVRESVQEVMSIIALKCKKSMAPYLKQLVPIWLSSNFDNYAPAASTAISSFNATFACNENKVREVCIFCQNEIVDYTMRNLTFHSATTLSSSKNCSPDEAEQKYQRVVSCSLKTLSFFLRVTSDADIGKVQKTLQDMLENAKYWSFAKSKVAEVKSSWFEVLYYMLQNATLASTLYNLRSKVVAVCFQNIDESEPLVAPHVWGCILLVQSQYDDWHDSVNLKKAVIPKLSSFLRNGCNKNANVICANLLPFLSKLTQETFKEINLHVFYGQFFDDIKIALTTLQNSSKSDLSALTTAYFECLRYIIQKVNIAIQEKSAETDIEVLKTFVIRLLNENIISLLKWCLTNESPVVKFVILHTSILIAFWADPEKISNLYVELLNIFWENIKAFILAGLIDKKDNEIFLNHVIELSDKLYCATPKVEDQKVKFAIELSDSDRLQCLPKNDQTTKLQADEQSKTIPESAQTDSLQIKKLNNKTAAYIESDLKNLVIQLVRVCLSKSTKELSSKYLFKVHKLSNMFNNADFYARISEEKTIMATLKMFIKIMDNLEDASCDDAIDITFEILTFLTKEDKFNFIEQNLLKIKHRSVQNSVINRLLSYPLNAEPEVRKLLSHPDARNLVIRLAEDVIKDDLKDSLNLLRKCFFQNDAGAIPIDIITADEVLKIISQPLMKESEMEHLMDECGSFIAQTMPVICSAGNSSAETQQAIFLKLFKFSIEHTPDDFISEDTLWEISTCWQDALSSQDILADTQIIHQCKDIVANCLQNESLSIEITELIAESVSQFIICSTEHLSNEKERFHQIDLTIEEFFKLSADKTQRIQDFCLFLEALFGKVTAGWKMHDECMENLEMVTYFRQLLLNSCIIYNLVCKSDKLTKSSCNENHDNSDYCDAKINVLKQWSDTFYDETIRCINMASVGDALIKMISQIDPHLEAAALQLSVKVETFLHEGPEDFTQCLKDRLFEIAAKEETITASRSLLQLVHIEQYAQFEENATILLLEDLTEYLVSRNSLKAYVNALQYLLPHLSSKVITTQTPIMKTNPSALWIKAAVFRCLVQNNFSCDYNEKTDQSIIAHTLQFLSEVSEKQHADKELLLYNVEIQCIPLESVVNTMEFMNILREAINKFPSELTIKNWDAIRIGLSSWVLSVSKSLDHVKNPQVALFTASVFRLYESFANFIQSEKQKSSTVFMQSIIDEWENLFDREVNLVLFKTYYKLVETQELAINISTCYNKLLEVLTPAMQLLNYGVVFNFYKTSTKISSDHVLQFLLKNLSNSLHCVRTLCVHIIKKMTQFYVELDVETYDRKSECISSDAGAGDWHFLCKFEDYIGRYSIPICKYINEYNFKLTEIAELKPIDRNEGLSYLLLWDCIIYACANSPITLRSLYTNWLHENRYEENLLHFLFRAMPAEILKNHDSKIMLTDAFKGLTWQQIQDRNLAVEKYACHLYTEVLRKLPAAVRKWWNTCPSRQKTFVDKLTSNFVSPIICSEELKAIGNKKEKHENMQVTVHTSTREVLAVYSIDEARMELVITLAQNYPLGSVKVDIGKQIGGRLSSRNTGMQLTIFLTHQNGSIYDGLTLWKNNLDKKFEGVEECYVCYTVIHQDTCQLPKLTCKTCRKKFHGPCLYKWFTTSSKSTCPICRNIF